MDISCGSFLVETCSRVATDIWTLAEGILVNESMLLLFLTFGCQLLPVVAFTMETRFRRFSQFVEHSGTFGMLLHGQVVL